MSVNSVRFGFVLSVLLCLGCVGVWPGEAAGQALKIAVAVSQTGFGETAGRPAVNAARLAVDEANAAGGPAVTLMDYDDKSTADGAKDAARRAAEDGAVVVVGPVISVLSLAAGPIYAQKGLVSIAATAHGDRVTSNATTFRPVFSTSEMGAAIAAYIRYVLGAGAATLVFTQDGYGLPMRDGFLATAARLGVAATARAIANDADIDTIAAERGADPAGAPIVMAMIDSAAQPLLAALRRHGVHAPIFGSSATASDAFAKLFASEPEAQRDPGYFTDGVYAISPSMLDSANAETLAVDARYRARFGGELQWEAVQAYDATRLAIAAARAAAARTASSDVAVLRAGVQGYLEGLDSPEHAVGSLTGPLWFTASRGRQQASRIGRFHGTQLVSAPVQLVPTETTTAAERESGAVVEIAPGQFARRQEVVYTGVYLNEISRMDIAQSTFTADFYLWLRFATGGAGAKAADPAALDFPDLVRGSFDAKRPVASGDLDDGTTYRLWRVRGEFKNDFDLHHYPFDRQMLVTRLFNAGAASDRIVYVQDRRSIAAGSMAFGSAGANGVADAHAFRNLTQWTPLREDERRDSLVTASGLGDPRLVGVAEMHELSGFRLDVEVKRLAVATVAKTLLPLGIMALIMLASLYFPYALEKEKITVAITGALSGAVLLSSVNTQLGAVGYTMAVEYIFYVFFGLCLLCIVAVLASERLRVAGRLPAAIRTEQATRWFYLVTLIVTIAAAAIAGGRW